MTTLLDSAQLSRHVVRIETTDGKILGTGFFVAPGWVLTCAHVVADLDTVKLRPAGFGEAFSADVRGRSASHLPETPSEIWPFPDLALVQYSLSHGTFPCVLLAGADPSQESDSYSWGFARREDNVDPVGSAVRLSFQGTDGDGYLSLRTGSVQPGLSGAPLVCPIRRAVVGVIAYTRDPRSDRGGWAAPVAALSAGEPLLTPDLAAAASQVLTLNRKAVLADRASWNSVLPVTDADDHIETTWAPFVRGSKSQPSQMLVAEHLVVPYLFHSLELERFQQWCENPQPMSLMVVAGRGGGGKTRFAIECCRRMKASGWVAGFLTRPTVTTVPLPRLVVVDYAEARSDLSNTLKKLRRSATDMAPVRVLLLTRTSAGPTLDLLKQLRHEAALQLVIDNSEDATAAETALEPEERIALFEQSLLSFSAAWKVPAPQRSRDLTSETYTVPLEVLVVALNEILSEGGMDGPGGPPESTPDGLNGLILHEEKYWQVFAPAGLDRDAQRECVALATLATAANLAEAQSLLALIDSLAGAGNAPIRGRTIQWLADLYEGEKFLNPLRPDRLGEALVVETLRRQPDQGIELLTGVLSLQTDSQVVRSLAVVARIAIDGEALMDILSAALRACYGTLVERSQSRARGSAAQPGSGDLAIALARVHVRVLSDRQIMPLSTAERLGLSVQIADLSLIASSWGGLSLAKVLSKQDLRIRLGLAAGEPGNSGYQRDLSISYDRLGDLAVKEGQGERARELFQQGLEIRIRLAAGEPGNTEYQRDLSVSYNMLGNLAVKKGQGDQTP